VKITVKKLLTTGIFKAPRDWQTKKLPRPHRLYYIIGGKATFHSPKRDIELLHGKFYLFPSTLPFTVTQDPDNRLEHMYFDFILEKPVVSLEPMVFSMEDHSLIPPLCEAMKTAVSSYRDGDNPTPSAPELYDTVVSLLESFLSLVLTLFPPKCMQYPQIAESIEYISANYSEPISVKELAMRAFLSEDHFIRLFKRAVGTTPYSYILNLRMSVIPELCESGLSLAESTRRAGFGYSSSYIRAKHRKRQ
jgi:AraC-like DNA-binding protein